MPTITSGRAKIRRFGAPAPGRRGVRQLTNSRTIGAARRRDRQRLAGIGRRAGRFRIIGTGGIERLADPFLELALADRGAFAAGARLDQPEPRLRRLLAHQGLQADRVAQAGEAALAERRRHGSPRRARRAASASPRAADRRRPRRICGAARRAARRSRRHRSSGLGADASAASTRRLSLTLTIARSMNRRRCATAAPAPRTSPLPGIEYRASARPCRNADRGRAARCVRCAPRPAARRRRPPSWSRRRRRGCR